MVKPILQKIKFLNLILIFFSFLVSSAQGNEKNLKVEYIYSNDFFSNNELLIANDKKAIYVRPALNIKRDEIKSPTEDDGNWKLPIQEIKTSSISIFKSAEEGNIYDYTVNLNNERYIVKDSTFSIKWKIDKSFSKKINEYNCFKASTTFRGRNYIAYFTPEIPISFGPFKFDNLPGLILQLENTDTDIKHSWTAKKIDWVNNNNELPSVEDFDAPTINLYQIYVMNNRIKEAKSKRFSSRVPAGVKHSKTVIKNLAIEKSFEWN